MMFSCRSYCGVPAQHMHLANFCFRDREFEAELSKLAADIPANSWYANQLSKRARIGSEALALSEAHALEMFKKEGVAPDAAERIGEFFK